MHPNNKSLLEKKISEREREREKEKRERERERERERFQERNEEHSSLYLEAKYKHFSHNSNP